MKMKLNYKIINKRKVRRYVNCFMNIKNLSVLRNHGKGRRGLYKIMKHKSDKYKHYC